MRYKEVSIHAPVKGATSMGREKLCNIPVSIHAPVKGATVTEINENDGDCFNSRTRKGCDLMVTGDFRRAGFQFTHP